MKKLIILILLLSISFAIIYALIMLSVSSLFSLFSSKPEYFGMLLYEHIIPNVISLFALIYTLFSLFKKCGRIMQKN